MRADKSPSGRLYLVTLVTVLVIGVFLRLPDSIFRGENAPLRALSLFHFQPMFTGIGFDEGLYREYVRSLEQKGLVAYPDIVEQYIAVQKRLPSSILPPVRFLYIFCGYVWHSVFGVEALASLRAVASLFSIFTLLLTALLAARLKGPAYGLGVAALMAVAPTQIHMSQHALVDGVFAFWALLCLWLLWENLRAQGSLASLVTYVLALSLLVLTKENAFFVFIGIFAIFLCNRWFNFGSVTRPLVLATVLGPLLGVVILIFLAGGVENLLETYRLSVSKNYQLPYAILTGDGPWHRYIVDLLLVSPIILILAIGAVFRLDRTQKPELFVAVFLAASYLVMCNIKYGMNLRYANMWDMPLRFLAFSQVIMLVGYCRKWRIPLTVSAILLICALEISQYVALAVHYPLYELVTQGLLRALHILK